VKEYYFIKTLDTYKAVEAYIDTTKVISNILFELDPIGTGCAENEQHDEYFFEGDEIAKMLYVGFPLVYSVKIVFDTMFWDDCLSEEMLNTICSHIPNSSNL
jgi:hypothetical protein